MRYISLFSGIGGLESGSAAPLLCCELDPTCAPLLVGRFGAIPVHDDVRTLDPPAAEVVAGGWPCQDLSVAGLQRGLAGERSGLFFELLRVAEAAGAHTIVAENVPNLLTMQGGAVFQGVLAALAHAGYDHVAWRVLNARAFGLPHQRRRIFLIASRHPAFARALHRPLPVGSHAPAASHEPTCSAFYWTAGLQSICYSRGYVPALKVGSALSIPSPPALHFAGCVRTATATECLRLQGFDPAEFGGAKAKDLYRMAGNAVAAPVGRFALDTLDAATANITAIFRPVQGLEPAGLFTSGSLYAITHPEPPLATNLADFIDTDYREPLSIRAATGLLTRLARSGKPCPPDLRAALTALTTPPVR